MSPSAQGIFSQTNGLTVGFSTRNLEMIQHGHCYIWTKMDMSGLGVDEKVKKS